MCYLGVGERGVCRGHVVHLGEPKQLHRSFVIGEVLCNVIFSRHFADDTGFMHVSVFFHFAHDMGVSVFFWGMSNYSHDICRYYNMVLKYHCIIIVLFLYIYCTIILLLLRIPLIWII